MFANFQILDIIRQLIHDLQTNLASGPVGQFWAEHGIAGIQISGLVMPSFEYSPDRPLVALFAVMAAFVVGWVWPAHWSAHIPPFWKFLRRFFERMVSRADNFNRSAGSLVFRGGLITAIVFVFILLIYLIFFLFQGFFPQYRLVFEGIGLFLCLSGSQSLKFLMAQTPDFGFLQKATRVQLKPLDEAGLIRLSIYWVSMQFSRCVLLPVFGYLVLGLIGAFIASALGWLVWFMGRDNRPYTIAAIPAFFERIAGTIPHIVLSLLLIFSSLIVSRVSLIRSLGGIIARGRGASYGEGGVPLTLLAYSNNITLGGPMIGPSGAPRRNKWIGAKDASAKCNQNHLRQSVMLVLVSALAFMGVLAALTMIK